MVASRREKEKLRLSNKIELIAPFSHREKGRG
jgi:hypothetical protein